MQSCSKHTVKMHYTSVLAKLQKHIAKKWPQLHRAGWKLHHNTQPHVTNYIMQFVAKFNITNSPNLAPCDFLFPSLKTKLQGIQFETSEAVLKKSEAILNDLTCIMCSRNSSNAVRSSFNYSEFTQRLILM